MSAAQEKTSRGKSEAPFEEVLHHPQVMESVSQRLIYGCPLVSTQGIPHSYQNPPTLKFIM